MSDSQVIPEAAVEAAARAIAPTLWDDSAWWPSFHGESSNDRRRQDREQSLIDARAALEAAAPTLQAQAWAEGHEDGFWNGRLSDADPSALTGVEHAKKHNPYRT